MLGIEEEEERRVHQHIPPPPSIDQAELNQPGSSVPMGVGEKDQVVPRPEDPDTTIKEKTAQFRRNERDNIEDSYGIGSTLLDMLSKRAFGMTPIRDAKDRKLGRLADKNAEEDGIQAEAKTEKQRVGTKRMYDAVGAVGDPASPFYGDANYLEATVNDPAMKKLFGIKYQWSAAPTKKTDPETGMKIFRVMDADPKTGEINFDQEMSAPQLLNTVIGGLNPKYQQEIFESLGATATDQNRKMRVFNDMKQRDPELAEYAASVKQNPIESQIKSYKRMLELIETNEYMKKEGWTPSDVAMTIFGKRMSADRYDFQGTELVPDEKSGKMGFKVYDKQTEEARIIPIEQLSIADYQKYMQTTNEARAQGRADAKPTTTIGGSQYTKEQVDMIKNTQVAMNKKMADYHKENLKNLDPEAKTLTIQEAALYHNLLEFDPLFQKLFDSRDKDNKKLAASTLREMGLEKLAILYDD